jgi:flagellar motor switch protein FliN
MSDDLPDSSIELEDMPSMALNSFEENSTLGEGVSEVNTDFSAVETFSPKLENVTEHEGVSQSPSGAFLQIPISVKVILGSTTMALSKVLALGPGSVISLDQQLSEPVHLLVNGNEFARGSIVVIDEATGQLGVTLTDIAADAHSLKKHS